MYTLAADKHISTSKHARQVRNIANLELTLTFTYFILF